MGLMLLEYFSSNLVQFDPDVTNRRVTNLGKQEGLITKEITTEKIERTNRIESFK